MPPNKARGSLVKPVVVGLTVGGVVAIKATGGGGPSLRTVLPANVIAFTKLDLNHAG